MPGTFYLVYQGYNDRDMLAQIHRLYPRVYPSMRDGTLVDTNRAIHRKGVKTRVGFVSAHFRRHSICKLLCGIIRNLDRTIFDVVVFSSSDQDDWTKVLGLMLSFIVARPLNTASVSFHLQSLAAETSFHHLSAGTLISNRDLVLQQALDVIVYPDIVRKDGAGGGEGEELVPIFIIACHIRREWTPKQPCGQARVWPRCK